MSSVVHLLRAIILTLALGLWGFGVPPVSAAQQGGLRTDAVVIETAKGTFTFTTEIADTPEHRNRGLMFRKEMGPDCAMLFDWGYDLEISMWMANTYLSLDMIFIHRNGQVAKIVRATRPHSREIISSGGSVAGVLEVVAGTADRIGLKVGDTVRHAMFK